MKFREVKCPSGAILKVSPAAFADSKALYQAMLREAKSIEVTSKNEVGNIFKDFFCLSFSSKRVESRLEVCFQKCIYNSGKGDLKIDKDTFEPVEARQDYTFVCLEVAKENVGPFAKSLYAEYRRLLSITESTQQ